MKIGITGSRGLVGTQLMLDLEAFSGMEVFPIETDVRDEFKLKDEIHSLHPDMIVHLAAITDVSYCEEHPEEALDVNAKGVHNLLNAHDGAYFIYLSTDHVFHGKKIGGRYTEEHEPSPVNFYGLTKLAGESLARLFWKKSIIVRSSKIFNSKTLYPNWDVLSFDMPLTFTDIIKRSFVHVEDFTAGLIYVMLNADNMPDTVHVAGLDTLSYYKFWKMIAREAGIDPELVVARKTKLIGADPRPYNGGLNVGMAKKLGVPVFPVSHGIKKLDWIK